jgi:hypothetical protein
LLTLEAQAGRLIPVSGLPELLSSDANCSASAPLIRPLPNLRSVGGASSSPRSLERSDLMVLTDEGLARVASYWWYHSIQLISQLLHLFRRETCVQYSDWRLIKQLMQSSALCAFIDQKRRIQAHDPNVKLRGRSDPNQFVRHGVLKNLLPIVSLFAWV